MKSLVELLSLLLADCGERCGAPFRRDVETLRRRVEHEGDSFLTITLPAFCSDFERSLDSGRIGPGSFLSFGKLRSGIPAFLQGFLSKVFDAGGCLLPEPSFDCILAVRQICLFCKKVNRPCSHRRLVDAEESFKKCDKDARGPGEGQLGRYYKLVARILMRSIGLDVFELGSTTLVPHHGPGATRERISGNQKWRFATWTNRLTRAGFTYTRFGRVSGMGSLPCKHHDQFRDGQSIRRLGVWDEQPVRVTFVPKTLKTPRVIAIEPVCMQYAQQALEAVLRRHMEMCPITRGHVNFTDQSKNQDLALSSSRDGKFATLDLSEASDRVSIRHVAHLLSAAPEFRRLAFASRSWAGELPSGERIHLKKFASMGSALCFPIESLVFFTSIIASRIRRAGQFPSRHLVHKMSRDVYVFGDDLVVPSDEAPAICDDLEALGFKVNRRKSFWTGKFRESCGVDAYDGKQVSPVYLRQDCPTDRRDVARILSIVATANQLSQAGYCRTSAALRRVVERLLGPLPEVATDSPGIGWHTYSEFVPPTRYNRSLQRVERLLYVVTVPWSKDFLDGDPALLKCLTALSRRPLGQWSDVVRDTRHLERVPRSYALALKRRWV